MLLLATLISTVVGLTAVGTGVHCANQSQNRFRRHHSINPQNHPKEVAYYVQFFRDDLKKFKKIVKHRAIPYAIALKIMEIALTDIIDLHTVLKLIEMSELKTTSRITRKKKMPEQFLQLLDKIDFSLTLFSGDRGYRRKYIVVFKKYHFQYVSTKQVCVILNYKKLRSDKMPTIIFSSDCFPCRYDKTVPYVNSDAVIGLYNSATDLKTSLSEYGTYLYYCNNIHPGVTSLSLDFYPKPKSSDFDHRWTFDEKVDSFDSYKFEDAFYLKHLTLVVCSLFTTETFERMQYALDHLVQLEKLTVNYTNLCSVALSDLVSQKMDKLITDHLHIDIHFVCIGVPEDHLTPSLLSRDTDYSYPEECETLHSKFQSLILQLEVVEFSLSCQFAALKQLMIAVFPGNTSELIVLPYIPSVTKLEILGGSSPTKERELFGVKVIEKEHNPVALNISRLVNLTHIKLRKVVVDADTVSSAPSTVTYLVLIGTTVTGSAIQLPENLKFLKVCDSLATFISPTYDYNPRLRILFLYDFKRMRRPIHKIIRALSHVIKEVILRPAENLENFIRISYLPPSSSVAGLGRQNYFFIVDIYEVFKTNCGSRYLNKSFELNIHEMPSWFESYGSAIVNVCDSFVKVLSKGYMVYVGLDQSEAMTPTKYTIDNKFRFLFPYIYSKVGFEFTIIDAKLVFPV